MTVSAYFFGRGVDDDRFAHMTHLAGKDRAGGGGVVALGPNANEQTFSEQEPESGRLLDSRVLTLRSEKVFVLCTVDVFDVCDDATTNELEKVAESLVVHNAE